jgi:hypothetical protein
MSDVGRLYEFVYRATLTEEALDRAGRPGTRMADESVRDIAAALSLELLDADEVATATRMAVVYTAIAAFENGARRFVARVLRTATVRIGGSCAFLKKLESSLSRAEKKSSAPSGTECEVTISWITQNSVTS